MSAQVEHIYDDWIECWQCFGFGQLGGCFEDTCCGVGCDPEDPVHCCNPHRCDVCKGKGGWPNEDDGGGS